MPHTLFERFGELFVLALKQRLYVGRGLLILGLRTEPFDTRPETSLEVIFEARTSQFSVDVYLARPQLKRAIDQIERFAGEDSGQKRAVIVRAVANDPPGDDDLRKRLIGQFQVRVRLVVLQKDVEPRLVLFDQVRFEHERLDLVIDDDELKIGDQFDQIARLGVEIAA